MLEYSGTPATRPAHAWACTTSSRPSGPSRSTPTTAAPSNGSAHRGGTPSRRRRRCRTSACTCAPGSTTSPHSSAPRRWRACAASRLPRWRCRITPTSPTNSSARCATAATSGCWCKKTRSSSRTTALPAGAATPAAPARLSQRRGSQRQHRRHHQDPGQRHQAGRPDAAVLRSARSRSRRDSAAERCRRW